MSDQMVGVSLLGAGTVLRLESDAWSMVKLTRRARKGTLPPRDGEGMWSYDRGCA